MDQKRISFIVSCNHWLKICANKSIFLEVKMGQIKHKPLRKRDFLRFTGLYVGFKSNFCFFQCPILGVRSNIWELGNQTFCVIEFPLQLESKGCRPWQIAYVRALYTQNYKFTNCHAWLFSNKYVHKHNFPVSIVHKAILRN